jgi:hypothetical protein
MKNVLRVLFQKEFSWLEVLLVILLSNSMYLLGGWWLLIPFYFSVGMFTKLVQLKIMEKDDAKN